MKGKQTLWKAEYLVAIDVIDEQHKTFFDLCLEIANICDPDGCKDVSAGQVIRAIVGMRSYAFKHFYTEETLMAKYHFPGLYKHTRCHDEFLRDLMNFSSELEAFVKEPDKAPEEAFIDLAQRISEYAADWWAKHILEVDTIYAGYVLESKGGKA